MKKISQRSAYLHCDRQQAFRIIIDNRMLKCWLAADAEVEPLIGGKYKMFWVPDDRENNRTPGCRVTAIETDRFLAFEWKSPEQFKNFVNQADPLTNVVIFFTATAVHLLHSGWRGTEEWEAARQCQGKAWELAFREFKELVIM